eukprot:TRINITY_DN857_c1_g2_i1.p1 TRINITY_DN857_c1_g2~~TRINITY_DN857_c1_g2_i1.p1  ORF type:complete len:653 (-),score=-5.94 TRINITY_DN857_c1_g2_i1:925-2883(-)
MEAGRFDICMRTPSIGSIIVSYLQTPSLLSICSVSHRLQNAVVDALSFLRPSFLSAVSVIGFSQLALSLVLESRLATFATQRLVAWDPAIYKPRAIQAVFATICHPPAVSPTLWPFASRRVCICQSRLCSVTSDQVPAVGGCVVLLYRDSIGAPFDGGTDLGGTACINPHPPRVVVGRAPAMFPIEASSMSLPFALPVPRQPRCSTQEIVATCFTLQSSSDVLSTAVTDRRSSCLHVADLSESISAAPTDRPLPASGSPVCSYRCGTSLHPDCTKSQRLPCHVDKIWEGGPRQVPSFPSPLDVPPFLGLLWHCEATLVVPPVVGGESCTSKFEVATEDLVPWQDAPSLPLALQRAMSAPGGGASEQNASGGPAGPGAYVPSARSMESVPSSGTSSPTPPAATAAAAEDSAPSTAGGAARPPSAAASGAFAVGVLPALSPAPVTPFVTLRRSWGPASSFVGLVAEPSLRSLEPVCRTTALSSGVQANDVPVWVVRIEVPLEGSLIYGPASGSVIIPRCAHMQGSSLGTVGVAVVSGARGVPSVVDRVVLTFVPFRDRGTQCSGCDENRRWANARNERPSMTVSGEPERSQHDTGMLHHPRAMVWVVELRRTEGGFRSAKPLQPVVSMRGSASAVWNLGSATMNAIPPEWALRM